MSAFVSAANPQAPRVVRGAGSDERGLWRRERCERRRRRGTGAVVRTRISAGLSWNPWSSPPPPPPEKRGVGALFGKIFGAKAHEPPPPPPQTLNWKVALLALLALVVAVAVTALVRYVIVSRQELVRRRKRVRAMPPALQGAAASAGTSASAMSGAPTDVSAESSRSAPLSTLSATASSVAAAASTTVIAVRRKLEDATGAGKDSQSGSSSDSSSAAAEAARPMSAGKDRAALVADELKATAKEVAGTAEELQNVLEDMKKAGSSFSPDYDETERALEEVVEVAAEVLVDDSNVASSIDVADKKQLDGESLVKSDSEEDAEAYVSDGVVDYDDEFQLPQPIASSTVADVPARALSDTFSASSVAATELSPDVQQPGATQPGPKLDISNSDDSATDQGSPQFQATTVDQAVRELGDLAMKYISKMK
mmetsp:Transcript_14563/g.38959  ORF Transcript_14563/g.38959 Transcript_14563/m.38959 type:complete len:426 (+) Transcript_14563:111-1388(+)